MNWDNFFIAQAGAAAALTGLIFVAVSINLNRILAVEPLPNRALQSLILLLNILIVSSLMLIPGQSEMAVGIELTVLAIALWTMTFKIDRQILKTTPDKYKANLRVIISLTQLAVIPFIISGVCIMCIGRCGIYILVPGILFSFIKAITDSWVLLVEINR